MKGYGLPRNDIALYGLRGRKFGAFRKKRERRFWKKVARRANKWKMINQLDCMY